MPRKKDAAGPSRKPRKPSAAKSKAMDAVPKQTDLFDDLPGSAAPAKSAKTLTEKKRTKSPAKPAKPAAPPRTYQPRTTAEATKEYIQRIPYSSVMVIGYVAVVLAWDAFITVGDTRTVNWAIFLWRPAHLQVLLESLGIPHFLVGWMSVSLFAKFDLFKTFFWLLIPLAICLWRIDLDYFGTRRVKREDWWFLGGICLVAVVAIVSVKFIPVLAAQYRGLDQAGLSSRIQYFAIHLLWVVSWLPGWEFMHRYFLLRRVAVDFPRFGWLLVPLAEGTYHFVIQKPWPETLAMVVFSMVMTQYVLRRRNIVIPFLGHLAVEVFLIIGMLVW